MWGYGWLLLLSSSKLVLLFLQCLFAVVSALFILTAIRPALRLNAFQFNVLMWLVVLSLPWYALSSVLWPHSVATSLLLTSLGLLIKAQGSESPRLRLWLLSGLSFGIMLNFRSDYILLPVGLLLVVLVFDNRPLLTNTKKLIVWCAPVLLTMIPWGVYTQHTTGHYLQTSTNGGHVLYFSLGQLPGNSWGITPRDDDPSMAALLESEFGKPTSPLTYEADVVLKSRFRELVFASPGEYTRKVVHNVGSLIFGGTYAGAFHEQQGCSPDCLGKYIDADAKVTSQGQVARGLLTGKIGISPDLDVTDYVRLALLSVSVLQSLLVAFFGFLLSIVLLPYCLHKRNVPMLLLLAVVGYQMALGIFTFYMRAYSSSVYVLLLVVIVFCACRTLEVGRRFASPRI